MKIGRDITIIPRYISGRYAVTTNVDDSDITLFRDYTSVSAQMVKLHFASFELNEAHLGYLQCKVGIYSYFVPYNLVPTFPTGPQVTWLEPIIGSARLTQQSKFCFSGSSTFLGKLESIGDLDFCEYIPTNTCVPSKVNEKWSIKNPELREVKCGKEVLQHPFGESVLNGTQFSAKDAKPLKLDFVFRDQIYDALAVTNVGIITDCNEDDPELKKSFAFQEVIISLDGKDKPHRKLDDVYEFARYTNWLREQVDQYIEKAEAPEFRYLSIKALKRALSWFLIVGVESEASTTINGLNREKLEPIVAFYRAAEVAKLEGSKTLDPTANAIKPLLEQDDLLNDLLNLAKNLQSTINTYMKDLKPKESV